MKNIMDIMDLFFMDIMKNKLSSNFEQKLLNSSVDWEGDLYNVNKIPDFPNVLFLISGTHLTKKY